MTTAEQTGEKRTKQWYIDATIYRTTEFFKWLLSTKLMLTVFWGEIKYTARGLSVLLAGYKRWALVEHHRRDIEEMRSVTRKLGTPPDLKAVDKYNQEVRRNRNLTLVALGLFAFLTLVLWLIYRDNPMTVFWWQTSVFTVGFGGFVLGIVLLCDALGRRYVPPVADDEPRPISPINPSMTITTIQNSIKDVLRHFATKEIGITFHGAKYLGDNGIEFEIHTTDKIVREDLEILEKHLQIGKGMAKLMPNRVNTAAPILRIYWNDPLAESTLPDEVEPKSRSVYEKFHGFRDELGARVGMKIVGSHQFWAGGSGSGKSSSLWVLLDFLVDCRDADVYGIDIGGTVFGPYRRQMTRVGTTTEDAEEILDELVEESHRRVEVLDAKMAAEEEMEDENWRCTEKKGERAVFLVIDEYSTFAKNKSLREKVERLYETGRKTRVHVIVATPDASSKAMGNSTTPINQAMIKVIFGIPFSMIPTIFGPGSVEEGWRPDIFEPSQDGNPGDAGKCMIRSAEFGRPIVQRFDRLELSDIHARNRKRRGHITGAPTLPEPLAILKAAFLINGKPEKLPTRAILEVPIAAGWDDKSLSAALRELGEETKRAMPAPKKIRLDSTTTAQGYEWAGVEVALKAFE